MVKGEMILKKYQTLLFDVDDTLLDFAAAEVLALNLLFESQNIPPTKDMEDNYKKINHRLWSLFEEGKITRDEVVNTRFSLLYKEMGQLTDGVLLEKNYRGYLEEGNQLINGAFELVSALQNHYELYIVTNGVSRTQDRRLRDSGLHPLFKEIFVSEDTGFQKPMKEFFDYVFARIPNFPVDRGLIIGDSLSSDIKGGQLAGLDTCWFNPDRKPNNSAILPTYQIEKLDELYQLLNLIRI